MVFVDRRYKSENFNERRGCCAIDMVIIHYTDMDTVDSAIARLCDVQAEVSAHYVIAGDGRIFGLVGEEMRAWHAGVASWEGESNINDRSIGIELDYPGHRGGLPDYPDMQIVALIALLDEILVRHNIRPERVLGHEDVAPSRKLDPGEKFPWHRLIQAGVAARRL